MPSPARVELRLLRASALLTSGSGWGGGRSWELRGGDLLCRFEGGRLGLHEAQSSCEIGARSRGFVSSANHVATGPDSAPGQVLLGRAAHFQRREETVTFPSPTSRHTTALRNSTL